MTNSEQNEQSQPTDPSPIGFAQTMPIASPHPDRIADLALVERLQQGDATTWNQVVEEYTPRLYDYLKTQLPSADDAADVLSETLMGLVQTIRTFDNSVSLATLLYSIAYRKVADYWRHRTSGEQPLHTAGEKTAEELAIQALLDELPEEEEHILLLRYHKGLSLEEIAHHFGLPPQRAATLLKSARQNLQAGFSGEDVQRPRPNPSGGHATLLVTVLQMLAVQQQRCLQQNMPQEATLFQHAYWFLQRLTDTHAIGKTI